MVNLTNIFSVPWSGMLEKNTDRQKHHKHLFPTSYLDVILFPINKLYTAFLVKLQSVVSKMYVYH